MAKICAALQPTEQAPEEIERWRWQRHQRGDLLQKDLWSSWWESNRVSKKALKEEGEKTAKRTTLTTGRAK